MKISKNPSSLSSVPYIDESLLYLNTYYYVPITKFVILLSKLRSEIVLGYAVVSTKTEVTGVAAKFTTKKPCCYVSPTT